MSGNPTLSTLADRFLAAADRWPRLESILFRWPESMPMPRIRMKATPGGHVGEDGTLHYAGVGYGMRTDTPEGRYRDGYAGALWLHRAFATATAGGAMEVSVSDNEASEQFHALARLADTEFEGCGFGLSEASTRWKGVTRWRLIVHELCGEPWYAVPAQKHYETQRIRDVLLASGLALQAVSTTAHSPDFRSLRWGNQAYTFTAAQAHAVKLLYEAWHNGTPDVSQATLVEAVDEQAPPERLRNVFRRSEAWNTLIIQGERKGTRRLADPT